ncbi:MAG: pyruvate kinase [Planctomycetota bacterium]|nr:MAG: pyruvate kinase [Planctomycetota bacterium]
MPQRAELDRGLSLTKIVATLGPASSDEPSLRRLIDHGVSVVRFNFSHGSFDEHAERLALVRRLEREVGRPIGVLGDLPGPKIRVTEVAGGGIELRSGQDFIIRRTQATAEPGATPVFGCTYERIVDEAEPGHRVLINDGAVRALVVEARDDEILCRVTVGGLVTTGKGVNLPDSEISAPALTDRDWAAVEWAVEHGLDFLAMSFVRRAEEVRRLRARLAERCVGGVCGVSWDGAETGRIPVIAKIEKPQAVANIEEILDEADGVMVARGDLGVEMDLAEVPVTQKMLIMRAQAKRKPCIVATQMLESMIDRPSPTRAEVSDVANAIYDAADAVMLSGETAVGKHGALAVDMMRRIGRVTESRLREPPSARPDTAAAPGALSPTAALAHGAWAIARDLGAALVACWSEHGETARLLSRLGFRVPVVAFSSDERAVRRMTLLYAVTPVFVDRPPVHRSEFGRLVEAVVLERALAAPGDTIVVVSGKPLGQPGATDSVTVQVVGE